MNEIFKKLLNKNKQLRFSVFSGIWKLHCIAKFAETLTADCYSHQL